MKTYVPATGSVAAKAIEFLKAHASGFEIASAPLAEAIGQPANSIQACLEMAVRAGLVVSRKPIGSRLIHWSLGNGTPLRKVLPPDETYEADEPLHRSGPEPQLPKSPPNPLTIPNIKITSTSKTPRVVSTPASEPKVPALDWTTPAARPSAPAHAQQQMRCALWSDGTLQIQRAEGDPVTLSSDETRALLHYLDRLRDDEVTA